MKVTMQVGTDVISTRPTILAFPTFSRLHFLSSSIFRAVSSENPRGALHRAPCTSQDIIAVGRNRLRIVDGCVFETLGMPNH